MLKYALIDKNSEDNQITIATAGCDCCKVYRFFPKEAEHHEAITKEDLDELEKNLNIQLGLLKELRSKL